MANEQRERQLGRPEPLPLPAPRASPQRLSRWESPPGTELALHNNQLSGEIPAKVGDLYYLIIIRLSANQLTGCVPAGLQDVRINDFEELGLDFCES